MALLVGLSAFIATAAHAQESPHAALRIAGPGASELDRAALAAALTRELRMDVTDVAAGASITVEITVANHRATLVVIDTAGATHRRIARLHRDPRERTEQLVIQIVNLTRDEASELLASMRRPPAPPANLPEEEALPEPEQALPEPEQALPEPEQALPEPEQALPEPEQALSEPEQALPEPEQAQIETPPTDLEADTEAPAAPSEPTPESTPEIEGPPFLRIGLGTQLGSTPSPTGIDLVRFAGLEVAVMPVPFLALGVREVGGGLATNSRWHAGGAAFAELMWRLVPEVELYGSIGAHVQYLGGADRPYAALGVAPLGGLGIRFIAERIFALGIDTEVRIAATDSFHTGLQIVPQGAVVWTGGLHALFLIH
jgi:hypothetical protein